MKIIFMGTPDFAVKILETLSLSNDIVAVVTQPDKVSGRKNEINISPVKNWALNNQILLFQPNNIKKEYSDILKLDCDIIVTAAYGQIIPSELLNFPKYKCINVHASLLPKYRGGAPIQRAILNGESETGISIIYMTEKMDAGKIIMQKSLLIGDDMYQDELFYELSILGASMILDCLHKIESNLIAPIEQDEAQVTYAPNIKKEDEKIIFSKTALQIKNQVRALNPNPGCFFEMDNKTIKIYKVEVSETKHEAEEGTVLDVQKDKFLVSCSSSSVIEVLELQLEGKKRMPARDFLNGVGRTLVYKGKNIK